MSEREVIKPERPAVPMSLYALACVICAERFVLGWACPPVVVAWVALVVSLVCAITCVVLRLRADDAPLRLPVLLCAATLAALLSAGAEAARGIAFERAMETSAPSAWTFVVTSGPTRTDYGYRCSARAFRRGSPSATVWLTGQDELESGDVITCVGRYAANEGELGAQARRRGIWGRVTVVLVRSSTAGAGWRQALHNARGDVLSTVLERLTPARAVIAGALLGQRDAMAEIGLTEQFSATGISHLVAVSGTHISLLASMATIVLLRTRLGPRARSAVLLALTAAYVVFCGAPASAVRAWVMTCVAFGSELLGRRSHALSSVGIVALVLALATPGLSGDLGFLLSVVSVCSICLLGRYLSYAVASLGVGLLPRARLPARVARRLAPAARFVCDTVGVTLAAQLATLPLTAPAFDTVSLVAPVANLLLAPVLPVLMALGIVSGCLLWAPPAAQVPLVLADAAGALPLGLLGRLARMPVACVPLASGESAWWGLAWLALVALVVWWPNVNGGLLGTAAGVCAAAVTVLLVSWRWFAPARVCVLDVGQGDAILVQDGGSAVLVDAGPGDAVIAALARNHVLHLDAVVVTHLHDDHYGGVVALAGRMGCDQVIVADGVAGHIEGELEAAVVSMGAPVGEVAYGDVLRVGGFSLEVVWPRQEVDGSENAHSLEMVLAYDEHGRTLSGLLTGDAERDETGACVANGDVGDVDFLKVGHHGSEVSIDEASAQALDPEVSVASAGAGNEFGHPRAECVEVLENAGSVFLCTIDCGDVELRPGVRGPVVLCQRGSVE